MIDDTEDVSSHPTDSPADAQLESNAPLAGKHWVYVPDHPPPKLITSQLSENNILQDKRPRRITCYLVLTPDPKSHAMAMKSPCHGEWMAAEAREVANMKKHDVWLERLRQDDESPISSTWAYRKKLGPENQVIEYKARICAQGFKQTLGINFEIK